MCVIVAKPTGSALPDAETLSNCEFSNRDGIGIAWTDSKGIVRIKKDFAGLDAFNAWLPVNVSKADACLIHFRMATHGAVIEGLRHPFPVSKSTEELLQVEAETDIAMAHNGVLAYEDKKGNLSDTAIFIRDVLADPGVRSNIRGNPAIEQLISGTIGSHNKLAFLYGDGMVWLFGEFEKEKGLCFSNSQYKWGNSFGFGNSSRERDYTDLNHWRRGKNMDYCFKCFQEFPVKKLYVYHHENEIKGNVDYVCGKCKYGALDKQKKCDLCLEFVPANEITRVNQSDSDYDSCLECLLALQKDYMV